MVKLLKPKSFMVYNNYVITPPYDIHKAMGLLRTTISGLALPEDTIYTNFISSRILQDEIMIFNAYTWIERNPIGLMIGLVQTYHVNFVYSITGCYTQMMEAHVTMMGSPPNHNIAVLLNPTTINTIPSGSVSNMVDSDLSNFLDKLIL